MKNIEKLIGLVKENPNRKVVAMVANEVVGSDEYYRWAGFIGKVKLDEIYSNDERIYYKSNDCDELLEEIQDNIYIDNRELTDEELEVLAEKELNKIPWEKVIIMNIDV